MREEFKTIANAALAYAHKALFSVHIGTLESDQHLLVMFHNVGVGRKAAVAFAERFKQYESAISDADDEDYSSAIVFYVAPNPDAVTELEHHWRKDVNAALAESKETAVAAV